MPDKVYSVSELTGLIRQQLEERWPEVWVEGQVSNYRGPHSSGHHYFSLKDEGAVLKATLFRNAARSLTFRLEEGQKVLALGRLSLYEPRGEYQLSIQRLEPRGVGALQLAFEQLKRKLEAEGLFEPGRKRPLPAYPRRVAVITSPTGAVWQDILHVSGRRCPWVDLLLLPSKVQGEGAAEELARALRRVGSLERPVDLVILARGGGSLEDLWAFNEEAVARAIAACKVPVLSAVGHETDYSIADFVADRRAPTPSAAAEIISPSREQVEELLSAYAARLRRGAEDAVEDRRSRLAERFGRLTRLSPRHQVERALQRLDELSGRLRASAAYWLRPRKDALVGMVGRLHALSPLAILGRGYAAAFNAGDGSLLRSAAGVAVGSQIDVLLGKGRLRARVESVQKEGERG